ncbi:MAG TPA: hypothetical protein ENN44_03985 [Methanoculleus sp.]|nr:hypothetical protein [Methanoculleus sp.]
MRNQSSRLIICLALLCAGLAGMAGCLDGKSPPLSDHDVSVIPGGTPVTPYAGTYEEGDLLITVPEFQQHWNPDGTCYWDGRIQVTNTAPVPKTNVIIRSSIIDIGTGTAVETKSTTYPRIGGTESLSLNVQLRGECDGKYTFRVETIVD